MKTMKKGLSALLALIMLVIAIPFGGLTAFASATDGGPIYLDDPLNAWIGEPGEIMAFEFTPEEDGKYSFYSTSDADTRGYIYDKQGNCLASDDDGGIDNNFKVICNLTAGVTYELHARYYSSSQTGKFEVCVSKYVPHLIESITFDDLSCYVWDYNTRWDYSEEIGEEVKWKYYPYTPKYTVTYTDGTSEERTSHYLNDDNGEYFINTTDDQSCLTPWAEGDHTVSVIVENSDFTGTFTVKVIGSPVASVEVEPFQIVENTNGHFKSDTYEDENGEYVETPEYFYYYMPCPSEDNTTITLKDGTVINGTGFDWEGSWFSIDVKTANATYENRWSAGNTYQIQCEVASYEFTYDVEIVETPVASVEIAPYELLEGANGYYTTGYRDENHNWNEDTPEYFHYYTPDVSWDDVTITLKDGTDIQGTEFEWNGKYYYMSLYGSDQDYYHQWTVGNTYQLTGDIAGYAFTYDVKIVETPVESVVIEPIVKIENSDGYYTYDTEWVYDEETGEEIRVDTPEYFIYDNLYPSWLNTTITLKDGTVINETSFEWNGNWYYLNTKNSGQNYNNQWTAGNTYEMEASIAGYTFTYPVEIIESPVESVTTKPVVLLEGIDGYYTTDEYWDKVNEQYVTSPEYYRYNFPYLSWDDVTITLKDGTVIEGTEFEWNGRWYGISSNGDNQSYENQWSVGNTYEIEASIAGYNFTYPAQIMASPVESVTIEPIVKIENTNGKYTTDSYWDEETGETVYTPEYFYYHDTAPMSNAVTITLKDGTVIEGTEFEWNGNWYYLSTNGSNQSYENRWTVGNTYELGGSICGFNFTYTVEIIETPVESVTIEPIVKIENADGYYTVDEYWDEETGEYVTTPEYYRYNDLYPNWDATTITLKDGTVIEGTEFEWNGNWYCLNTEDSDQNYENQWTVGTYEIEASIAGYDFTYPVEIIESPVDWVEVKPIVYYEGSNGDYTCDEVWDVDNQEWVYSPEYFRYHFYSRDFIVHLKDGSVHEYGQFEWNGRNYWVCDLENEDDQSYENQWTAGNTYTQTRIIAGYVFDFEVEIAETPVESIVVKPMMQMQYSNGYYTTDEYYNEETGEYIRTPEYFYYHTPYPNEDDVVITLKDGTVINNYGFYLDDEWVSISVYGLEQSYENQWLPDTTRQINASFLGYKFTYEVTLVESPIESVVIEPVRIVENTNGWYTYDNIEDPEEGWISSPEYFRYHTPWPENAVITLKDGTVINGTEFEWNGGWHSIGVYETDQSYENQWTAGNSYEVRGVILGHEFTFTAEIIQLSVNDSFEYMESEDGIIITDSFIAPETLEIPAEIDGMPVIGVASLCGYDGVKHLIFPDSVRTIGDYVIGGFSNLETVTFGTNVRNLNSYMFAYAYHLSGITVAGDNENYTVINGVLYNKAVTKVIAYPIALDSTYEVPSTVTDISALDLGIYSDLEIVFPEDHPYYVTVDGVTYNKDMTKVLFCSKDKAGSYTMPDTVIEIAPSAFEGCNQLTEVIVSSQVTEIVYCVFSSCASLEKVELPNGLISIGERAFENTEALENIELPATLEHIGPMAFISSGLTSLRVPDSVIVIDYSAFAYSAIATLNLGDNVVEIYERAFAGTPVTAVRLPDSLQWLGSSVFESCEQLKTLSFGNSLREINSWTFANTALERINIPATINTIGNYAFAYSAISELTLNEGLREIYGAFQGCGNLVEAAIPASVEYISERAFADCDSLTTLTVAKENETYHSDSNCIIHTEEKVLLIGCGGSVIPTDGSVEIIGDNAFYDSDNLETITIPGSVSHIGYMTFFDCDQLTEVVIPDSVVMLDAMAFCHCDNLTSAIIGDGIQYIGANVFAYCPLTSVDLGSSLPCIPELSFAFTDLTEVFIPDSVTGIMYGAFSDCSDLTSIELPLSVQSIEFGAFCNCESLTDVYYEGTEADRENIDIGKNNDYLLNATWHYEWTNEKWDGETTEPDKPDVPDVPVVPDECEHEYDDDYDADCNLCGETREVPDRPTDPDEPDEPVVPNECEHEYDDDYDADCNLCGETREVPDHPGEGGETDEPAVTDGPLFIVDGTTAKAGDTFTVALRIENNPGIISLKVDIGYDADLLELISIKGQDFSGVSFGPLTNNPIAVNWLDAINANNTSDGAVALLEFRVKDDAPVGLTAITVSYYYKNVYDSELTFITFDTEDGIVEIVDYMSGDVDNDGEITNKDLGMLMRYVNGWEIEINESAGDVDRDGEITNLDLGILQRYINGWDVELL